MKRVIILAAALLAIMMLPQLADARGNKAIDSDETERRRDGLVYELGEDTPLTGLVRRMHSRRKKQSDVNYVDGKPDGPTTRWWPDGQMQFSGLFEGGQPVGLRTTWYQHGNKRTEFTLVNGVKHGLSTKWYPDGNRELEETFVDGVLHGLVTTWNHSGSKKAEVNYAEGQQEQEGPTTKWNDKGQIVFQGNYVSGKFTGEVTSWTGNGQAFVSEKFVDGTQTEYAESLGYEHANGQQRGEQRWINGKRQETFWYENGQKERHSTVSNEAEDSRWTEWYENGQIKRDYRKEFGVTEGPVTDWYENGQKKSESNALHGKKHGVDTEWFNDGSIKSEIEYVYGRRIGPTGELLDPVPPKNTVVAKPNVDVTYTMHTGPIRFRDAAIQSVSDGTISGNTAIVAPGATINLTGNWQIGLGINTKCPACNVQIYVAWLADAPARGAWPPNDYLWRGQARSVKSSSGPERSIVTSQPPSLPGGSFDWTTQAPRLPGVYYIGRGQTLDFSFNRMAEGGLGSPTDSPDTVDAASFRIEVR